MGRTPVAAGTHRDPAGIGLRISDKFWNRPGRKGRIYLHHLRNTDCARDRRDVADEVVVEAVIERGVDCGAAADREEGVAVGRRAHDRFNSNVAAAAGTVLDDELLTETLRQPLAG